MTGVVAGDLKWHASVSGSTFTASGVSHLGGLPSTTWIFTGAWSSTPALANYNQTITITLDGLDSPGRSHIVAASGQGAGRTQWSWNFFLKPPPVVPMLRVY